MQNIDNQYVKMFGAKTNVKAWKLAHVSTFERKT